MVVLNRIYTRAGDEGMTMLGNGEQRKKYDLRVAAYGTVDEVTAAIGVVRLHTGEAPLIDAMLKRIQNDLFDLAADLCSPDKGKGPGGERLAVNASQVKRLEDEIDTLNAELAPLRTFVLAGGAPPPADPHLARPIRPPRTRGRSSPGRSSSSMSWCLSSSSTHRSRQSSR